MLGKKSLGALSRRRMVVATALVATATIGATVAMTVAAKTGTAGTTQPDARAQQVQQLTALADKAIAAGVPGIIVRVDDGTGRQVEIARQAGWTVGDHRLKVSDQLQTGSTTKTITGILILQQVAEHRLSLDDPIERWLPGAIPEGRNITIRMLLQHNSGLEDFTFDKTTLDLLTGHGDNYPTPAQLLDRAAKLPLKFAPGKGWAYSNPAYIALGMVLEKVTKRPYSELVQQRIVRPLHLRDTYMPNRTDPRPIRPRMAHGYEPDAAHLKPLLPEDIPAGYGFEGPVRGDWVDITGVNPNWYFSAGGLVSTSSDWGRIHRALMTGRLVPAAQLKEMMNVVQEDLNDPAYGPNRRYGLGLEQVRTPCGMVWGHDGAVGGYNSDIYVDRAGRRTYSVHTTTLFSLKLDEAKAKAAEAVVDAAACVMLGKPIPAPAK
ncbi:serine hydrolase domain-containing protein [Actinoplanes sp. NPDC049265]|uniref:serine hydrolase domain-containing protein n=1 Tax=Actinoplanes sp. NPDC049265 TaxID=3363902 RepID=UPI003718EAFF